MSRKSLESVVGEQNAGQILEEVQGSIGEVSKFKQVGGGLVHYVYRVTGDAQSAYLKLRANHYSGIPNISTQPELIVNEKRAIELFSVHSGEYFPEILLYSSALHFLLLSDVMPGGTTLDKQYSRGKVSPTDIFQLGRVIGSIHEASNTQEPVRTPNDKQYQSNLMLYALESYKHPVLLAASEEHKRRKTQLLIGDLSPKNTYVEGEIVRMCDLENAHQGALPYDQAFAIAHVLLHHPRREAAIVAMWAFLDGYESNGGDIDHGDALLAQTLHGILLYRLDNPVIPYDIPVSGRRRNKMTKNVFSSLNENSKDVEVIAANLFKK